MRTGVKRALSFVIMMAMLLTLPLSFVSADESPRNLEQLAEVRLAEGPYVFNGLEQTPEIEVVLPKTDTQEEIVLTEGVDYQKSFANNIDAGTASYYIEGMGAYCGKIEGTFEIAPCDIGKVIIEDNLNGKVLEYNAKDRTPILSLYIGDKRLEPMQDYEVQYKNNLNAGTMSVLITAIQDNFTGSFERTFRIEKKDVKNTTIKITVNQDNTVQMVVTNPEAGKTVVKNVDYTYTVVKDGKGHLIITIKGIGTNYIGTITKTVEANPEPTTKPVEKKTPKIVVSKTKIESVKKSKKKIKVGWKKVKGVDGYQIRYSKNKSMKKAKKKTINKNTKNYSFTTLKKKTKYYLQVRAFKKVEKKCFYAEWSKPKTIKMS